MSSKRARRPVWFRSMRLMEFARNFSVLGNHEPCQIGNFQNDQRSPSDAGGFLAHGACVKRKTPKFRSTLVRSNPEPCVRHHVPWSTSKATILAPTRRNVTSTTQRVSLPQKFLQPPAIWCIPSSSTKPFSQCPLRYTTSSRNPHNTPTASSPARISTPQTSASSARSPTIRCVTSMYKMHVGHSLTS
jgi:hypothetical protein